MKKLLIAVLILLSGLCAVCACNCNPLPNGTYIVKYIIDGEELYSAYAQTDEIIGMPVIEPREGYVFKGWYLSDDYIEKWDFENDTVSKSISLYSYWVAAAEETFNVVYYDGVFLDYEKIDKGGFPKEFFPEEKFGYEFKGWAYKNELFDFTEPVNEDYALTAVWDTVKYSVEYVADGEIIEKFTYTVVDEPFEAPSVPGKPYYTGKWETFTKFETTEVNAIYEPIVYTAKFIDGGTTLYEASYTVEDTVTFPVLPPKEGYVKEWESVTISGGDITVNSIITPIVYYATYVADGITVAVEEFTVENKNFTPPAVPPRDGYEGAWENKNLSASDVVINAHYEIKIYKATFVIDGRIIAVKDFQIDDMQVDEPEIPEKEGFTASWNEYELSLSDITITAEYVAITYYANFYAEGELFKSVPYTVKDETIKTPEVPAKAGYSGEWEEFTLITEDIDIEAKYSPIEYKIKFVCDDEVYKERVYTVEHKDIDVPEPKQKDGYTAKWEDFTLTYGDITVNAVYTAIVIDDFEDEFTYGERPDGTLTVTGYFGTQTEIIIPTLHEGKRVKAISDQAFLNGKYTSVIIREGIESIGYEAFQSCSDLQYISLPESLKTIGGRAFAFCGFENISLPKYLVSIGEQAFTGSKLLKIVIPNSVKAISNAFFGCSYLTEITLGSGLTKISTGDFNNCTALERLTVSGGINEIEPQAFNNCSLLNNVIFEDCNGWSIKTETGTLITNLDPEQLSIPSTAADFLKEVYSPRYWIKE